MTLAAELVDLIAADPVALERLRELVGDNQVISSPPAFTVATLAAELGRSERWVRARIASGELAAVKRGRGYVISAEAVAELGRAPGPDGRRPAPARRRSRSGPGPMRRALG